MQRQTLSEWLEALYERDEQHGFAIELMLTLAGDKPACSIETFDLTVEKGPFVHAPDRAIAFIDELGLSTKQLDANGSWYCARSRDNFDLLPTVDVETKDDHQRQMARFFGYPDEDAEWFIDTPPTERVGPRERAENGDFAPSEIAHVDFLPYTHDTSIGGYRRAIETGKRIRQRMTVIANRWDVHVIDSMAEEHYEVSRSVYAGERDHFPGEHIGFKMIVKNPNLE